MTIRWTGQAAADVTAVCDFIYKGSPDAARRVAGTILRSIEGLQSFPALGRLGRLEGTRELILTGLPYIVVYEATSEAILVLRVLHGSQRWP